MAGNKSIRSAVRGLCSRAAMCTLAAVSPLALAAPVSGGTVAGLPGELVSPVVRDSALVAFEAADLAVTFDPTVLSLVGMSPGPAFGTGSLVLGTPSSVPGGLEQMLLSLAIDTPFDGVDVTMFEGVFRILAGAAPGFTTIRFETLDPLLYDIDLGVQVQVLAANEVPEAGTGWLVMAAGCGMLLARRRRRAA